MRTRFNKSPKVNHLNIKQHFDSYESEFDQELAEKKFVSIKKRGLKSKHGLTILDYESMEHQQNGLCLICGQLETTIDKKTGKVKRLAVDHSHESGKIRGLLCLRCNMLLGFARDNVSILQKAIEYLRNTV